MTASALIANQKSQVTTRHRHALSRSPGVDEDEVASDGCDRRADQGLEVQGDEEEIN
jgi:hypothetical protein